MAKNETGPTQTCVRKNLQQKLSCSPCLSAQISTKVRWGEGVVWDFSLP